MNRRWLVNASCLRFFFTELRTVLVFSCIPLDILSGTAFAATPMPSFGNALVLSSAARRITVGQPIELVLSLPGQVAPDPAHAFFNITYFDQSVGTYDPEHGLPGTPLCANVGATLADGQWVSRCVAAFGTPGVHILNAQLGQYPAGVFDSDNLALDVEPATAFDADQRAASGAWYDSATSGQGLDIKIYADQVRPGVAGLFGGWFTFDGNGNQRWYTLQGSLGTSNSASFNLGIFANTSGVFGAPPVTGAQPVGSAALVFYDCEDAALSYTFDDGRSGTIPYVRLGTAANCSDAVPPAGAAPVDANENDILHGGAWYDPATAGQGFNIQFLPQQSTFFATWYTYAPASENASGSGAQRWLTLQTNDYTPGNLSLHAVPVYETSAGVFDTPSSVITTNIGTADVTMSSCSAMTITYQFTQGEFAGLSGSIKAINPLPASGCH